MSMDKKQLRAEIADSGVEQMTETIATLLEAAAEFARELRLSLPEFVQMAVDQYAESHDREITHFECTEEPDGAGHSTVVAMADKWRIS